MAQSDNKVRTSQGLAVASLVLGIVSIVSSLILIIPVILGILAIVFGAVSLKSVGRKKAIAGIITGIVGIILSILAVVIVALALPALQANQRDTVRKNDVSQLVSDITTFQSDHRGVLPNYDELSTDNLINISSISWYGDPTTQQAVYAIGTDCNGANTLSTRTYSISLLLENGTTYCVES